MRTSTNSGNPIHCWDNLNDGRMGNSHSWLTPAANLKAGVFWSSAQQVSGIGLSRDAGTTGYGDRGTGSIKVEVSYTPMSTEAELFGSSDWVEVGSVANWATVHQISWWQFSSTASGVYALRITPTSAGDCFDELQVVGGAPAPLRFTVSALGAPLFDETAVDDADVYVTLSTSDLGLWNPFSWYPYVPPSKWAAIVTEATDTSAIATLFDRGYGWVYLTSEGGFNTKSTITSDVFAAIEATATMRRLQGRRLEASTAFWGCDDTLLECQPICMRSMGAVTSKVSDKLCAGAPMDQCACICYHDARWTCDGLAVVCKAKYGAGELQTVGDKVCEMRGAPKPASTAELRIASECEPMTEMRGSAPTAECLAQWGTPEPQEDEVKPEVAFLDESFAATFAFAALAIYA
jgi:hypothetical protein